MRYRVFLSWLLVILASIMVFGFIGLYSMVQLIPRYENNIESWLSRTLQARVNFTFKTVAWEGNQVRIKIQDLDIDARDDAFDVQLDNGTITLNLFDSLLSWHPRADAVSLKGLEIRLYRSRIKRTEAEQTGPASLNHLLQRLNLFPQTRGIVHTLSELSHQNAVTLDGGRFIIDGKNRDTEVPFALQWRHRGDHYRLNASAQIRGAPETRAEVNLTVWSELFSGIHAHGRLTVQLPELGRYLTPWLARSLQVEGGKLNWQSHIKIRDNHVQQLRSHMQVSNAVVRRDNTPPLRVEHMEAGLRTRFALNRWELTLTPLAWHINGKKGRIGSLSLAYSDPVVTDPTAMTIKTSTVDLGSLSRLNQQLAPWYPRSLQALQEWQLSGKASATFKAWLQQDQQWRLKSRFATMQLHNKHTGLSVSGLKGQTMIKPRGGWITLDAPALLVEAPAVFAQPLPPVTLQTFVDWHQQGDQLLMNIYNLSARSRGLTLQTAGKLQLPPGEPEKIHTTMSGFLDGHRIAPAIKRFLPRSGIDPELYEWLTQNITRIGTLDSSFVLDGPLDQIPFRDGQGYFSVVANIGSADFYPQKKWPLIHDAGARLWIDNETLRIYGSQGSSRQAHMDYASYIIPDISPGVPTKMLINGRVTARRAETIEDYVYHSPLQKELQGLISQVAYYGDMTVLLDMALPMGNPDARDQIGGTVNFNGGTTLVKAADLPLYQTRGSVDFVNNTYHIDKLGAYLGAGAPVSGQLETTTLSPEHHRYHARARMVVPMAVMARYLPDSLATQLLGSFPLTLEADIDDQQDVVIKGYSDLRGLASRLPEPADKKAGAMLPLSGRLRWFRANNFLHGQLNVAQRLQTADSFRLPAQQGRPFMLGRTRIAAIPLKQWVQHLRQEVVPGKPLFGFHQGRLMNQRGILSDKQDKFPGHEWFCTLQPANLGCRVHHLFSSWQINTSVSAREISWADQGLAQPWLNVRTTGQARTLTLADNQATRATLRIPKPPAAWELTIPYLAWSPSTSSTTARKPTDTPALPYDSGPVVTRAALRRLAVLPPLNVKVNKLEMGGFPFESFRLQSVPRGNGIQVSKATLKLNRNAAITASGGWYGWPFRANARIKASAPNWGSVVDQYGYKGMLEGGSGDISAELQWHKTFLPNLHNMYGKLDISVRDGVIKQIKPGIFAKLLGLFSIRTYFERLTTNYSDFATSGLMFNRISGTYRINNGIATTTGHSSIAAPSFDALVSGHVNLVKEKLDQTITVQPHLSGMFAIATGIVFTPVIGAVTYFAEELLGSTVFRDMGIMNFHITGDIENPDIDEGI